jgi:hypothetical protein
MPKSFMRSVVSQLQVERERIEEELRGVSAALAAFGKVYSRRKSVGTRRTMSAAGRARIAAAQRARWAKVKGQKVVSIIGRRRTMSAAARKRIAAAQKARWAKWRAKR